MYSKWLLNIVFCKKKLLLLGALQLVFIGFGIFNTHDSSWLLLLLPLEILSLYVIIIGILLISILKEVKK